MGLFHSNWCIEDCKPMHSSAQALVNCLELLEDENVDTRVCGCKALACLKVRLYAKLVLFSTLYYCRAKLIVVKT